ncbi:MAG: class I SAM-dependent methyltransferase, partial [Candidatus Eremiobacterota bacterium]
CLSLTEYLVEAAERYGIEAGTRCLDVACGTGVITVELANAGFEMTGLDRSRSMLAYARLRAKEGDLTIPFLEMDMRYFSVPEPFPWVICTHDSLDHLVEEMHLHMAIQQISEAVTPGGYFMFDMNCWEGIRHLNGKTVFVEAEDRAAAYYLESKDGKLKTSIVIFIKKPDTDLYQRFDEVLFQNCYSDEQIQAALDRYGFLVREKIAVQHLKGHLFKQLWICQATGTGSPVPDVL